MGDKLYIIVRNNLEPGQIAVQAMHAQVEFHYNHLEVVNEWYSNSNYLCLLECECEEELLHYLKIAKEKEIKYSYFRELDLNNSITAICLEPGEKSKKLCQGLKLALK